ncbi:MAG TPA: LysR family transcriptional regulator [Polyangiaceae bacterium]
MNIPWNEVELFLAVAETGSVSAAAKRLRTTQPTVSRRLVELEATLGEPLFARSVAGTTPTAFGERMLPAARRMAEAAGEVERVASGAVATPKGVVRVTAAPGVAYTFLAPFAAELRRALPEVRLEIVATTSYVDLVRREADLAIRMQPLDRAAGQRDLVAIATTSHPVAAFAAPSLAKKLPRGAGLADVPWIAWAPPFEDLTPNPQLAKLIPGFEPVLAATDYIVQIRAAEAGIGAILLDRSAHRFALPSPLVELDLSFGKLVSSMHLVCARSSLAIPRVKAVADLLAKELTRPLPAKPRSASPSPRRGGSR